MEMGFLQAFCCNIVVNQVLVYRTSGNILLHKKPGIPLKKIPPLLNEWFPSPLGQGWVL